MIDRLQALALIGLRRVVPESRNVNADLDSAHCLYLAIHRRSYCGPRHDAVIALGARGAAPNVFGEVGIALVVLGHLGGES